jgi:hypothetical protein
VSDVGPQPTYGDRTRMEDQVRAVQSSGAIQPTFRPPPAPMVDLDAPTARPGEPVTAGLRTGPGPGPEILGGPFTASAALRGWLIDNPYDDDVRQVIELLEAQGR